MFTLVHIIQETCKEIKSAVALFMNVKRVFDHVSKRQLKTQINEPKIDEDFVIRINFFLTN